jgi:hypothetical protein
VTGVAGKRVGGFGLRFGFVVALAALALAALPAVALAVPPTVVTKAASPVGSVEATLNGTVTPNGIATNFYFEYGTTKSYGSKTSETFAGSGLSSLPVKATVKALSPATTYHFRVVAKNASGTSVGADETFTTTQLPVAITEAATGVLSREAELHGTINAAGLKTTYYFEYGPTTSYGTKVGEGSEGGTANLPRSLPLANLTPATTYHFRIVATNSAGTTKGSDATFTTLASSWTRQSAANPLGGSLLERVSCVSGSACIAVGDASGGNLSERWNGSEWSLLTTPKVGTSINELSGVSCTAANACTAVGRWTPSSPASNTLAMRWNGSEWKVQETPNPAGANFSNLNSVACTSAVDCLAVGIYTDEAGNQFTLSETWNGSEWKLQETPSPGKTQNFLFTVSCTSTSACTAVGHQPTGYLAERWNGSGWTVQTTPAFTGGTLESVSCASATQCVAVGSTLASEAGTILIWNGSEWAASSFPAPTTGAAKTNFSGVSCPSTTSCYALGWYEKESEFFAFAEHWNGTAWSLQPLPRIGGGGSAMRELSCPSTTVCEGVGAVVVGAVDNPLAERFE